MSDDGSASEISLEPNCSHCGKPPVYACSGCLINPNVTPAMYCSNACREIDWPEHILVCPSQMLGSDANLVKDSHNHVGDSVASVDVKAVMSSQALDDPAIAPAQRKKVERTRSGLDDNVRISSIELTTNNRSTVDNEESIVEQSNDTIGESDIYSSYQDNVRGFCKYCGEPGKFVCSPCGPNVQYCSQICQQDDWIVHHRFCKSLGGPGEPDNKPRREAKKRLQKKNVKLSISAPASVVLPTVDVPMPEKKTDGNSVAQSAFSGRDHQFMLEQLYKIIQPVLLCILLSVFWIKITDRDRTITGQSNQSALAFYSGNTAGTDTNAVNTQIYNALIIMGQIIVFTLIVVILYKYKFFKTLYAILGLVTAFLLGFISFILITAILRSMEWPLDWISISFFLFNFTIVGLISIFWKSPMWVQQGYLVLISTFMAYSLTTQLQEWTTWTLLGILVVWDLIAVLCPFGPLKMLIEESNRQGREVPALLYTVATMVGFMARMEDQEGSRPVSVRTRESNAVENYDEDEDSSDAESEESVETDERGLKLGLGDFVFYSVLVARAALSDWLTTICCMVAILTGLCLTIMLLSIMKRALPALPISISFGIVFYFLSSRALSPFYDMMQINLLSV